MIDETQDIEIVDVEVVEESPDADVEQTIEIVEVSEGEEVVVESDEAFAPLDIPNEQLRHTLLTELEVENQHPIEAVTGLRTALDTINSLKSVYSDVAGVADYYEWFGGEERVAIGYFVSLTKDKIQIYGEGKINNPDDDKERIFGVTVDNAGFIGHEGFEEVVQHDGVARKVRLERDEHYALVATSGFVEVRCEVDVEAGQFVVANEYGKAQRSESDYGYKVVATETKHNIKYAIIALNVSADITEEIGLRLQGLDKDVEDIKMNLASMMTTLGEATDAVDELKEDVDGLKELDTQVQNATLTAEQAKAIAASAIANAETWRNEAIEKANEALAEAVNTRNELEEKMEQANEKLDDAVLEIQETQEDLGRTRDNLQESLDDARNDIEGIRFDLIPLESWVSEDGQKSSIAGFVARANEDSATLGALVEYVDDTNEALAGFKTDVAKNYATLTQLAALDTKTSEATAAVKLVAEENKSQLDAAAGFVYKDENGNIISTGLAGLTAQVTENSSELDAVASYEKDGVEGLAGLVAQVDENKSELSTIASYEQKDAEGNIISTGAAGLMAQVNANSSELSTIASYEKKDGDGNVVSTGAAGLIAQVDENMADIEILAKYGTGGSTGSAGLIAQVDKNTAELALIAEHTYVDENGNQLKGLAAINQEITDHGSELENLTSWQGDTNSSLALIKQKADANGASIQLLAANIDKYSVGENSQAYGFDLSQANDVLEAGMIYIPTVAHVESYKNSNGEEFSYSFAKGNLYTWTDDVGLDLNGDGTTDITTGMWSESIGKVAFLGTTPAGYEYWYKNTEDSSDGYEGNTLYKFEKYTDDESNVLERWTAVASLQGNSSNRAVSQIRQDANSIIAEVTNAYGAVAGFGAKLSDTDAKVNSIASWPMDGGKHNMAVLESKSDENGSYMVLAAVTEVDGEPKTTELGGAKIVLGDSSDGSYIHIDADQVMVDGALSIKGKVQEVENKAVYNTQVEYALSSSATEFIAITEWSVVAPGWRANAYMWQRTFTTRGDGSSFYSNPTCIQGAKGEDGTGVTIKGVAYVTVSVSDDIVGNTYSIYSDEDCTVQIVNAEDGDSYLIDGYLFVYSGSGTTFTCAGKIQGPTGDPGAGVSAVINYYMASSRSSGVVAGDSGETTGEQWTTTVQTMTASKPYLWNYETTIYTDSRSTSTTPAIIGRYGSDGRGIAQISEYYCVNSSTYCSTPTATTLNSATAFSGTAVSGRWYTTSPSTSQTLRYLWNCERIIYTDGTSEIFAPANIGTHGVKGDDGISINSTTVTYGVSSSASSKPTTWYSYIPTVATGQYLWTCTTTDYTDTTLQDTVAYTYAKQGEDGYTPIKGIDYNDGANGTSVTVSSIRYQAGTSATSAPTGTWSASVVSVAEGQYLWTKTTFSDGTVAYGVAKQGKSGAQVASEQKQFYLSTSSASCTGGSWSTSPSGWQKGKYMWTRTVYTLTDNTTVNGTPVLDNTYTTISGWCSANNTTLIDGANIATGTITAGQIAAGSITADKLAVGALSADSITVRDTSNNIIFQADTSSRTAQAGGWTIGPYSLYTTKGSQVYMSGSGDYTATAASPIGRVVSNLVFRVGSSGSNAVFGIGSDGHIYATKGYIGDWYISNKNLYCGTNSTFFADPSDLHNPYGQSGRGVQLCTSALNTGDGAIGGISIGCCPVSSSEAYNSTYHQQFIYGMYHMFRSRMSYACYALNINSQGIYFKRGTDDIGTSGVSFTNYISNNTDGVKLMGTWQTASAITVSSARTLKTEIDSLEDKHSVLFDNLLPRQFKYNDGESGRIHYGLIVDELKSAMDIAGITPTECAAYCLADPENPDGDGGIRYSELIALCIKEIQTLKQKVKELEKENTNE